MNDENSKPAQPAPEMAALAIPQLCPNDGSILVEGTKYGFPAWLCPTCTYWKLRK